MALPVHDRQGLHRPPQTPQPYPPIPANDALLRPGNDNRRGRPAPELDCLIGTLPADILRDAAARARALAIGADRVLIARGLISEAAYLACFSRHTGIAIETFADVAPCDLALSRTDQMQAAARSGIVQIRRGDEWVVVIVPCHLTARNLMHAIANDTDMIARLRLASAADFDAFLLHGTNDALGRDAAFGLRDRHPALCAAPHVVARPIRTRLHRFAIALALAALLTLPTSFGIGIWAQLLAIWFIAAISLRLVAALTPLRAVPRSVRVPDANLPVYSVIVALYREARSVPQLLRALNALDYPREKLDIIIAVEADDDATRDAIGRFGPIPPLRVIVAPGIGPRTKPKALNCALSFARGSVIGVFDAEDRPDPGQLRAALDVFRNNAPDIACAQASLCIDNADDSLFTRMFATEYAGQFEAVLPGLAEMQIPLPLGGTSNHFRADALRAVGGWDAWNVTEDADLGLRLARFGYRAVTFASRTQEEAPITFVRWLPQRTRWMKGWMQTWSVHMRAPVRLWRDAGWGGLAALHLVIGANIASALAYPVLLAALAHEIAWPSGWLLDGLLTPTHLVALLGGIVATAIVGLIGLHHCNRRGLGWILLLTPVYWGCLSIATYRALLQLQRDPYRWEKTEHGLARSVKPWRWRRSRRTAPQR